MKKQVLFITYFIILYLLNEIQSRIFKKEFSVYTPQPAATNMAQTTASLSTLGCPVFLRALRMHLGASLASHQHEAVQIFLSSPHHWYHCDGAGRLKQFYFFLFSKIEIQSYTELLYEEML